MDAEIDIWQGPDNTPVKIKAYCEDGGFRPFNAVIETPHFPNAVAVRNVGHLEFPLDAYVVTNNVEKPVSDFEANAQIVQGQSLKTYPQKHYVKRVEVMLKTEGRPLSARIELLTGPNTNKQVIEVYTDEGLIRPLFAIFETLEKETMIRVVNTAPMEFPMLASVAPHFIDDSVSPADSVSSVSNMEPVIIGATSMDTKLSMESSAMPVEPLPARSAPSDSRIDEDPRTWDVGRVIEYLEDLGFTDEKGKFRANAVDGAMLVGLSEDDLMTELSLTKLQARKVLDRLPKPES
jgi:hypothetical protein